MSTDSDEVLKHFPPKAVARIVALHAREAARRHPGDLEAQIDYAHGQAAEALRSLVPEPAPPAPPSMVEQMWALQRGGGDEA